MLLVLEIVLTIVAWRRGWRWLALLPLAIGAGAAFTIGIVIGAFGGSADSTMAVGVLVDVACIGTLIGMVVKPRRQAEYREPAPQRQEAEIIAAEPWREQEVTRVAGWGNLSRPHDF